MVTLGQAMFVCYSPRHLDGELEAVGHTRGPAPVGCRPVRAVERTVYLHGVEARGITGQVTVPSPNAAVWVDGIDQPAQPIWIFPRSSLTT